MPLKDMKIVFHDEQPHYSPGSTVKGEVIVTAEQSEQVKSIVVKILGQARVLWTEPAGNGQTIVYKNKINYIKEKSVVWSKENSSSDELTPGEHSFPFEYQLPGDNIPSSFEGEKGSVRYAIKVKILRSGALQQNLKSASPFTVKVNPSPELLASCMQQKVVDMTEHVKFCCFDFGSLKVTCDLPRTGFCLGDVIPINQQIENQSSKAVRIRTCLEQVITFVSSYNAKRVRKKNFSLVISPQINAGVITSFVDESSLKVPTDLPPTLSNCACIHVEYSLAIRAATHSATPGSSKVIKIPLLIHEQPTSTE